MSATAVLAATELLIMGFAGRSASEYRKSSFRTPPCAASAQKGGETISNVLARKRSVSVLEFYKNAQEIRSTLTRFVMNEKHVPKRYRFVFSMPTIELLNALFNNITMANTIYPINEHELQMRRDYQTKAIGNCEQILQMLQYMLETLPINADKLSPLVEMIVKETALLKAWRKSNKLPAQKPADK